MLQLWDSWIFLSQNFSLCSPYICCLTLRRIKQFSNVFVAKKSLKNANFVWKIGFGRFVFSTTVTCEGITKCLVSKMSKILQWCYLRTNRTNPIFHTKLAFSRGCLWTKMLENCLIFLRVKQHIQSEHKLKFWLKNNH